MYITAAMAKWNAASWQEAGNQWRCANTEWTQKQDDPEWSNANPSWRADLPSETSRETPSYGNFLLDKVGELEIALKEEQAERKFLVNKVAALESLMASMEAGREQLMVQVRFSQQQNEAAITGVKEMLTHFCNVAELNNFQCPHKLPALVAAPCPTIGARCIFYPRSSRRYLQAWIVQP